jgi:hypothetical protein
MRTQRVQMKGTLPWLVPWAWDTRGFSSALAAVVGPEQNMFFLTFKLFQFLCSHRPGSWAGSHTGSPVS